MTLNAASLCRDQSVVNRWLSGFKDVKPAFRYRGNSIVTARRLYRLRGLMGVVYRPSMARTVNTTSVSGQGGGNFP